MSNILYAVLCFALLGGALGAALALAAKVFEVKVDPRVPQITELLPGANCGGCGYTGCAALAQAIVNGEAKIGACSVGGDAAAKAIGAVMGQQAQSVVRMRAQVMCSGTNECTAQKYHYEGVHDCIAAAALAGGAKTCPNGCLGLGTCVSVCPFDAISVRDGVAYVDYHKCTGCGKCTNACPKHIIRLIPYDADYWVGCMSVDNGKVTRSYCEMGCISCKLCEKACDAGAIHVNDFVASIDYEKCVGCGKCVQACPRKIIWSSDRQKKAVTISKKELGQEEQA